MQGRWLRRTSITSRVRGGSNLGRTESHKSGNERQATTASKRAENSCELAASLAKLKDRLGKGREEGGRTYDSLSDRISGASS